jgi:hypothetical protein
LSLINCKLAWFFVRFHLAIVLSVLRYMASDITPLVFILFPSISYTYKIWNFTNCAVFMTKKIYCSYICFVQLIPFWLKKYTIHSDLYSFHISIVIDHRIRYIYIYSWIKRECFNGGGNRRKPPLYNCVLLFKLLYEYDVIECVFLFLSTFSDNYWIYTRLNSDNIYVLSSFLAKSLY